MMVQRGRLLSPARAALLACLLAVSLGPCRAKEAPVGGRRSGGGIEDADVSAAAAAATDGGDVGGHRRRGPDPGNSHDAPDLRREVAGGAEGHADAEPAPGDGARSVSTRAGGPPQKIQVEMMRRRWKRALDEIKDLVVETSPTSGGMDAKPLLNRWKLFLNEGASSGGINGDGKASGRGGEVRTDEGEGGGRGGPHDAEADARWTWRRSRPQRFDGSATWERRLQQWSDDASEYLERSHREFLDELRPGGDYPMSSYGRPRGAGGVGAGAGAGAGAVNGTAPEAAAAAAEAATAPRAEEEEAKPPPPRPSLPAVSPRPVRPGEPVVPHTDLSDKSKRVWIITTASLPWMTGTAVNPLLRAAYMTSGRKEAGGSVTIMLPWLERRSDQERVYGKDRVFETPEDQEEYVRTWLRDTANMGEASEDLNVRWYTAWQNRAENSVYSMGDITALIPAADDPDDRGGPDVCVLEEPEHLNWYRAPGESWTGKFRHVVGIVHTNYFVYAQEQPAALIRAPAMRLLCSWMCRAHCHRLIKLSGTLDEFASEKELVENVHGVRRTFLNAGEDLSQTLASPGGKLDPVFGPKAIPTVYFIGKMLWSKGLGSLMELLKYTEESADLRVKVDMYGGGPDQGAAAARSKKLGLDMPFHGPIDHAELAPSHKIFINPSTSEVLCTTIAEALAMGKFVIVPSHPSNDFFAQFPNCLTYANKEEFVGNLYYALTHSPEPLSEEYAYALSWEAATERFVAAGSVSVAEADAMQRVLSAPEAEVEIKFPPLIEDEERRRKIATTLERSRSRYRQFRSRLSAEIAQSNVLPADLQRRLVSELDKRLDLDLDTILESPKLRLKLSPAELDKQLLELYDTLTKGPSGDVLRVIGGGNDVAMQDFYLRRQALRERMARRLPPARDEDDATLVVGAALGLPQFLDDASSDANASPTKWIKQALRRNLPQKDDSLIPMNLRKTDRQRSASSGRRGNTKMSLLDVSHISKFSARSGALGIPMVPQAHSNFGRFTHRPPKFYGPLI